MQYYRCADIRQNCSKPNGIPAMAAGLHNLLSYMLLQLLPVLRKKPQTGGYLLAKGLLIKPFIPGYWSWEQQDHAFATFVGSLDPQFPAMLFTQ